MRGPFLFLGERKLTLKAVTYGTFRADAEGHLFPPRDQVREDFRLMRAAAVNTVRTYTAPPDWFFEEARAAGLRVLVGIYWDGRNCDFDDKKTLAAAKEAVREGVARAKAHPDVVLAYVIGNEIPPLVARFHGRQTIERFLRKLYDVAKDEDPEGLVTYGNYPTTEFLQLPFLDFHTLNVYLLDKQRLSAYLDRCLIEAKGKPLLIGEIGDDTLHKSEAWQAELLEWTIPLVLNKGVCGLCVFSWTDEWVVGGHRVEDWAFGLVTADRKPKPAYDVVQRRFSESPFAWRDGPWPRMSVVVCNYNGSATLDETLTSLEQIDYPDYEILLVEDGSTDGSLEIGRRHEPRVRVIAQENQGLGVARNVGAEAATGELVVYIDSDAFADPDWLRFLVLGLESGDYHGVGGPNLTPASDGLDAQFIALCPGNPTHVLKDNRNAEHLAGVNMAFRRDMLLGLGGFDPVHRRAGDDVDICWRFEDAGLPLAFSPVAIVWHHRRPSMHRYLKQQAGYGEAENQLERKHPERFNLTGHIRWAGRVYLAPKRALSVFKPFIYHGRFGMALFQTLYQKDPSYLLDMPRMFHWYVAWALLIVAAPFVSLWLLPVGLSMMAASMWVAFLAGLTTEVPVNLTRGQAARKVWVIGAMCFLHPVVRWYSRIKARVGHARPLGFAFRLYWMRPDFLAQEIYHLVRRRKQIRRYWGAQTVAKRAEHLQAIQQELKRMGRSTRLGHEWRNHDLSLNGAASNIGRLYSAPEHYDQAICYGFRAVTTGLTRTLFLILAVVAAVGAVVVWPKTWGLFFLLAPILGGAYVLAQRARMRAHLWRAVDAVMEQAGAKRYQPGDTPPDSA